MLSSQNAKTRSSRRLSARKKFAFGFLTVGLFLITVELVLTVAGVKPRYLTEDPLVGFDPGSPLFVARANGEMLRTNPAKLSFFNDQQFLARKTASTYRIFCLGGSTTFGHPYHDSTSFVGWLRARLRDADPKRDWQVINCGGISYASYRICQLMQELVAYQPDLFIFYEGHNEFLEDRTYGNLMHRNRFMQAADAVVMRTRIGTVLSRVVRPRNSDRGADLLSAEVETILDRSVGPERYHYDPKWTHDVVEHFRASLKRASGIARSAGAKMIFVKPASNQRNFSPFKSESSDLSPSGMAEWELLIKTARQDRDGSDFETAARQFESAARINPRHALTLWEAGDSFFKAGQVDVAREYFLKAVDEDVCPLRATSTIRTIVSDVAQEIGDPCIDFPQLIEDQLEASVHHRIPGNESFLDHVHPTIEQNRRLAWTLYDQLAELGVAPRQVSDAQLIDRVSHTVLDPIDQKQHALALVQVIQVLSWAGKNDEALNLTDRAEQTFPGLSEVMSYRGRLLEKMGKDDEAFECFQESVRRNSKDSLAEYRLGSAYLRRGEFDSARHCFADALRNTPVQAPSVFRYQLHLAFGNSFAGLGRWREAAEQFRAAVKIAPPKSDAQAALDVALKHLDGTARKTDDR